MTVAFLRFLTFLFKMAARKRSILLLTDINCLLSCSDDTTRPSALIRFIGISFIGRKTGTAWYQKLLLYLLIQIQFLDIEKLADIIDSAVECNAIVHRALELAA